MPAELFSRSIAEQAGRQLAAPSGLPASESFFNFPHIVSGLIVSGLELILALLICGTIYVVTRLILSKIVAPRR